MENRKENPAPTVVPLPLWAEFLVNAEEGAWVESGEVRMVKVKDGIRLEKLLEKPLTSARARAAAENGIFKKN